MNYSKLVTFLYSMILVSCPEWFRSCSAKWYKIFSNMTHQPTLREAQPNTAPLFFRVCLSKFIGTRQLFVSRPYFWLYSTEKRNAKLSWVILPFTFCLGCSEPQSKYKIWVQLAKSSILSKEPVGKQFFVVFRFVICKIFKYQNK